MVTDADAELVEELRKVRETLSGFLNAWWTKILDELE
jgi:hypothetical protein